MHLPSLSVIIPNYNHAHYISQCLRAILDQSVRPKEIIIIDDASTDNSLEVIQEFAKQEPSIKLISNEKNLGNLRSFLKGLDQATGDYLFGSAADDYILPGFFEASLNLLAQYPHAGLCTSLSKRVNEVGDHLDTVPEPPYISTSPSYTPPEVVQEMMLNHNNLNIMSANTLFNRKLALESDAFAPAAGIYVDAFAIALMAINYGVCFFPQELGVFRVLPESQSSKAKTDPNVFLGFITPMWKLMETSHSNKFPPKIRRCIKRRQLYNYGAMALNQHKEAQEVFLENLKISLDDPSFIDQLFIISTRMFGRIQFSVTKGYLFLQLRKVSWDILIRIFHRNRKSH